MQLLPRTQDALIDLAASQQLGQGMHAGFHPASAETGMVLGHEPFNPVDHSPMDIDPFSFDEIVTGVPHVPVVLPEKPLLANIIVHHDGESKDDARIIKAKYSLARILQRCLEDALPDNDDRSQAYSTVVSSAITKNELDRFTDLMEVDEDSIKSAQQVARLCTEGLSFVISDFKRLPLHEVSADYSSTIGLKVNHVAELSIPADQGIISIGGKKEVNTDDPIELSKFLSDLGVYHGRIITHLQKSGIAVSQIVFNPKDHPKFGFDAATADKDIAKAVRSRNA